MELLLDQYFEFQFSTQDPLTGAAADADALPTYRVYAEGSDTAVASGECSKVDDANTVGYYRARGQVTAAGGYVEGTRYHVRVEAAVGGVTGAREAGTFAVVTADVLREDDIADLALQTTLEALMGAGWTTETLVAIMAGIEGINPGGAYVVTRRFLDSGGGAVADLKITVQGDDGGDADGTVVAVGTTSATGYVTFNLDAGTYHLLSPSTGVWQASDTTVTVAANSSANITVTAQTLPAPSAPDKYVIIINAADQTDTAVGASGRSYQVTRVLPAADATADLIRSTERDPVVTDANGQASFEIGQTVESLEVLESWTDAAGVARSRTLHLSGFADAADDDGYVQLADVLVRVSGEV